MASGGEGTPYDRKSSSCSFGNSLCLPSQATFSLQHYHLITSAPFNSPKQLQHRPCFAISIPQDVYQQTCSYCFASVTYQRNIDTRSCGIHQAGQAQRWHPFREWRYLLFSCSCAYVHEMNTTSYYLTEYLSTPPMTRAATSILVQPMRAFLPAVEAATT